MVLVGPRIERVRRARCSAAGTRWDVQMTKVEVDGSELLVCAVGGSADAARSARSRAAPTGALRILAVVS